MRMTKKEYNEYISKLEVEFNEACEDIADECYKEGLPTNGSTYDLRVDALKSDYPELFSLDCEPVYKGEYVYI